MLLTFPYPSLLAVSGSLPLSDCHSLESITSHAWLLACGSSSQSHGHLEEEASQVCSPCLPAPGPVLFISQSLPSP